MVDCVTASYRGIKGDEDDEVSEGKVMGWGSTSNRSMPHIPSYARAKEHWDNTKAIRGRSEHADRPLNARSDRARWIGKRGDAYAARLYRTDVVTYHPDETITLYTGGWSSKATAEFMSAVAPVRAELFDNRVWAYVNGGYYVVADSLTIKRGENGRWQPVAPQVTQYYRLNKERCKALRTSFKPFLEYAEAMFKLSDSRPVTWWANNAGFDLADEGTYYKLYTCIRGGDITSFRKELWKWAYNQYDCWDTLDAPLGHQVRQYP